MELLLAYGAGLLTLINPCVLPVLPIVLAGALQASRWGPLALASGMGLSFVTLGFGVIAAGHLVGLTPEMVAQAGAVLMIGFGIVLPLLPLYADGFGSGGAAIGLLVTSYAVAQFFMAPIWGRLSDRHGRKPILILGLIGSAFAYIVFAYSQSFTWLFASRLLAGVGGSTIPVAEAYIADVTPPERRAGNMGLIGAAFGLGFTIGPALGGILGSISFEAPGLFAAGLCTVNAVARTVSPNQKVGRFSMP